MRVLIIEARFYDELLDELEKGAVQYLKERGVEYDIVHVPGALEIPGAIAMAEQANDANRMAVESVMEGVDPNGEDAEGQLMELLDMTKPYYDAYVALGVVIRGETWHFEIVAGESARGIMDLTLQGVAIGNGILTVENAEQAWARAKVSEKNKGAGAAAAALAMAGLREEFIEKDYAR